MGRTCASQTAARLPRALLAVLAVAFGLSAAAQQPAPAAPAAFPRATARLKVADKRLNVVLVGLQADRVQFHYVEDPRVVTAVKVSDVQSVRFLIEYNREDVARAAARNDWGTAARLLYDGSRQTLPYLVLPENNAAALCLEAGSYLIRAAAVKSGCGPTAAERKRAEAEYRAAQGILEAVAAASWFDGAEAARIKAIFCLIQQDRLEEAARRLEELSVPGRLDDSCGVYWLTRAQLAFARGEARAALGDVVQSILLESKDLDSFPDALLLSGRCYDALEQPYRARDVYYEIARLFGGTHWAAFARVRLQDILERGLTREAEKAPIENVFFGIDEDVNAKAAELLGLAAAGEAAAKTPEPNEESKTP
jgi:tetratricopeptide (TPR) repeat protein